MKTTLLVEAMLLSTLALPVAAQTADWDCFPLCASPAVAASKIDNAPDENIPAIHVTAARVVAADMAPHTACGNGLIHGVDNLNGQLKPIKDLIGYVRSPQTLAMKLVNDHIVTIPAWIGFAMDPVGAIKHKAIDEVRSRAKDALMPQAACERDSADAAWVSMDAHDAKLAS